MKYFYSIGKFVRIFAFEDMKCQPNQQFTDDFLICFHKVAYLLFRDRLSIFEKKDNSRFYADPESQHGRRVTKIGQEKDNNSWFYIR